MTQRKIVSAVAIVIALGMTASCSDDSKKSSETTSVSAISKADFLTQGNALCASFNADVEAAAAGVLTEDDQIAVYTDVIIPGLRETLTAIENLGFPAGDEDTIQGLIDATREQLDIVEADPAAALNAGVDPFADINAQLVDYGLTTCGQG